VADLSPCVILSVLRQHQRLENSLDKMMSVASASVSSCSLITTKEMQSVNDHALSGPAA
jgi:hypothetical protein